MQESAVNPKHDIVDTARSEASFKTFLSALQAVLPMVDYLKGAGPFTVFMPTDQAFESLGLPVVQDLEKPENHEKLKRLIKHHIIKGAFSTSQLRTMQTLQTESGTNLAVVSSASGLKIDTALVLGSDILCTNGIIHAIDTVQRPV